MYDPATGRFTGPDPIGLAGGLNLYQYCGNDPVNFVDRFGQAPEPVTIPGLSAAQVQQYIDTLRAQARAFGLLAANPSLSPAQRAGAWSQFRFFQRAAGSILMPDEDGLTSEWPGGGPRRAPVAFANSAPGLPSSAAPEATLPSASPPRCTAPAGPGAASGTNLRRQRRTRASERGLEEADVYSRPPPSRSSAVSDTRPTAIQIALRPTEGKAP